MINSETTASFGYWVRRQRQALDLTQAILARQIGCATVTISKIERDERRPSRQMAELLAEKLTIPPAQRRQFLAMALGERAVDQMPLSNRPLAEPTHIEQHASSFILPSTVAPAIARPKEEADLVGLLTNPPTRLVTLVGAGGMGKTHLALQVAAQVAPHFKEGVVFVALETVTAAERVLTTVANTLGVIESSNTTLQDAVITVLSYTERLLILDNFEQVLAAAELVTVLLQACPRLKILVTSRESLQLRQEQIYSLPPMTAVTTHQRGGSHAAPSPAVQLFALRAQAVQPGFVLDETTTPTVAAICDLLDGLPLAIELAAARLMLFSLPSLLQELVEDDTAPLTLLQSPVRDRPQRQRSFRETIAWSYGLLSDTEQHFFRQLSVFTGGFTLEAAKAIVTTGSPGDLLAGQDLLTLLTSLVAKNLVVAKPQPDGTTRFSMLNLVGDFAAEMLAATEEEVVARQAHAEWYAAFAAKADAHLTGPEQVQWLDRLSTEAANLHEAIGWSITACEIEMALTFGAALFRFWRGRAYLTEGRYWLHQIVGLPRQLDIAALWATVLLNVSIAALLEGDYSKTEDTLMESITLARKSDHGPTLAHGLSYLGRIKYPRREYTAAKAHLEEAIQLSEERNYLEIHGLALTFLGQLYSHMGETEKALAFTQAGLKRFQRLGDYWGNSMAATKVANTLIQLRRYDEAKVYANYSLTQSQILRDTMAIALSLSTLAWLAIAQEQYDEARKLLKESLQIRWGLGDKHGAADNIAYLAKVALCCNQPDQAVILAKVAERAFQQMKTPPVRIDLKEIILAARNLLDEASSAAAAASGEVREMAELVNELLRQ